MRHGGAFNFEFTNVDRRRVCAPFPPRFLVKDNIAADVDAACRRIIDPVCLGSWLVADEDHGSTAIIELLHMWTSVLDVGYATEGPQVMYRRCGPVPQLVWCFPAGALRRCPVEDVDRGVDGLPQECSWEITRLEHAPGHPDHRLVPPFDDAILLRCIRCRKLAPNSEFDAIRLEFHRSELSPAIGTQSEEFSSALVLSCCLDSLDGSRSSIFGVEQCYPHVPAEVIDEEQEVAITARGGRGDWPAEIAMK